MYCSELALLKNLDKPYYLIKKLSFMKTFCLLAFGYALMISCNSNTSADQKASSSDSASNTSSTSRKPQPAEFADAKYADIGKSALAAMASGDINAYMSIFADNAKYYWNSGDSLIGKAAIADYWAKRRSTVIDSLSFMNEIWLPVKVNEPQQQVQSPGVWLLSWYQVRSKYKNGKTMSQWVHNDFHFDANDKVDEVVQYIDRAPIIAALGHK
jgi:hypothetical protein